MATSAETACDERLERPTVPGNGRSFVFLVIRHKFVYILNMSGHNKWSQIQRQKGAADSNKSKVVGKLANRIPVESKKANGDVFETTCCVRTYSKYTRTCA